MRLPALLISFLILLGLQSQIFGKGLISGKFGNSPKGENLKLYLLYGSSTQLIDSTNLKGGSFVFGGEYQRGLYRIGTDSKTGRVLVLGNSKVSLRGNWGEWDKITADPNTEDLLYSSIQTIIRETGLVVMDLNKKAQAAYKTMRNDPQKYQSDMGELKRVFDSVMVSHDSRLKAISTENPGTYSGKLAEYMLPKEGVKNYDFFDVKDLEDPEYLSGEMVKSKLGLYFQRYLGGSLGNWKERYNQLLEATHGGMAKDLMYSSGIEIFLNMDQNFSGNIAKGYIKDFPSSPTAKYYYDQLPKPPPSVGDEAPDISMQNPDGETLNLKDLRGQVVLVDFWASWCGPCRRENPNVVRTYKNYKDQGFTVFSVSLDKNKSSWLNAIQKDGLEWDNHVSDLKGWRNAGAKKYGVRGIPATFLVDEKGIIKAVNVRGGKLESELKKLIEKSKSDG